MKSPNERIREAKIELKKWVNAKNDCSIERGLKCFECEETFTCAPMLNMHELSMEIATTEQEVYSEIFKDLNL